LGAGPKLGDLKTDVGREYYAELLIPVFEFPRLLDMGCKKGGGGDCLRLLLV